MEAEAQAKAKASGRGRAGVEGPAVGSRCAQASSVLNTGAHPRLRLFFLGRGEGRPCIRPRIRVRTCCLCCRCLLFECPAPSTTESRESRGPGGRHLYVFDSLRNQRARSVLYCAVVYCAVVYCTLFCHSTEGVLTARPARPSRLRKRARTFCFLFSLSRIGKEAFPTPSLLLLLSLTRTHARDATASRISFTTPAMSVSSCLWP